MERFSYPEVGATAAPDRLPPGYHLVRERSRIGSGAAVFATAGAAVLDWRMHRGLGMRIHADAPAADTGVRVTLSVGVWPLRITAPCEVVRAVREPRRTGFAYGTLTGHPECGEEAFVVRWEPDDSVVLDVVAFSRAAAWYTRAAGPAARAAQRWYARRCGAVLRRLAA